jgi:hypothetical protein
MLGSQQTGQAFSYYGMIIGDEDTNSHSSPACYSSYLAWSMPQDGLCVCQVSVTADEPTILHRQKRNQMA